MKSKILKTQDAAVLLAASTMASNAATVEDPTLYEDLETGVMSVFDGFLITDLAAGPATLNIRYGRWTGAGDAVVDLVFSLNGTTLLPSITMDNTYFSSPESTSYDVTSLLVDGLNTLSAMGTLSSGGDTTYGVGELSVEYVASSVPLPAGLPLLLSALAVGGVVSRRKKNA